jgi:hypothetical protein
MQLLAVILTLALAIVIVGARMQLKKLRRQRDYYYKAYRSLEKYMMMDRRN